MKFFVVALNLVAICSAFTQDEIEKDKTYTQECNVELGITKEESDDYQRHIENYINDTKAQNSAKCFLKKYGFFDRNGDFQLSVAIEKFSTGKYSLLTEEQVKLCAATAGDNKANGFAIKLYACSMAASRA